MSTQLKVNPANGNLTYSIPVPRSVPTTLQPQLTYNSLASANTIQFGRGVADSLNPTVSAISGTIARL
ncbi:MAG: hypothetical protein R3C17_21855, partial [Planctomycetaceae bacterium]